MLEFQIVDHPQQFPGFCAVCQSQTGPFLDTFAENAIGRIYLCKSCARRGARIFGFSPGKRMTELNDASVLLEQKQVEVEGLINEMTQLQLQNGAERAVIKDIKRQLDEATSKLQTIEHLAAQVERASKEMVEAVAPRTLSGVA